MLLEPERQRRQAPEAGLHEFGPVGIGAMRSGMSAVPPTSKETIVRKLELVRFDEVGNAETQ